MLTLSKIKKTYNFFGPGIILAGTAIGVSHLVQSVQAGAKFGLIFITAILVAHITKYPFFEFSPRYTAAKGKSLIYGYGDLGKPILFMFFILTLVSMLAVQSAVTVVAASILANIFDFQIDIKLWTLIMISICYLILILGKYDLLDNMVKIIVILLSVTTIFTVCLALGKASTITRIETPQFDFSNFIHITFLIGFLGWMPCPLDCSVWNSIWITEKNHTHLKQISLKRTLLDFNVGYVVTAVLAIFFLILGYITFYGTATELPSKGIPFIKLLFSSYTNILGDGAFYLIAFTAFAAMFSTVLSVFDAFARTLAKTVKVIKYGGETKRPQEKKYYIIFLSITYASTIYIAFFLMDNMADLVKVATIASFLTTPIIAVLNYKLVTRKDFPKDYAPSYGFKLFAKFCIIFLVIFALWYLNILLN